MQFSKAAVFRAGRQASPLVAPRASPGAFRSQALATGAGVQYRQMTNIASTSLSFIANERNASVASKTAKASAEAFLAWETAYQKAKVEQPDSPESWTQIADKAGNESVSRNVGGGDIVSNILFGEDDAEEKIGISLTKLKAKKAGEVQKGRVDARKRHYKEAQIRSIEHMNMQLEAIGVDVANLADTSATSILSVRKSAAEAFKEFSKSLDADALIPSAAKRAQKAEYVSAIGNTLVNHIIRTDAPNAIRYIDHIDRMVGNSAYRGSIDLARAEVQKARLVRAYDYTNSLSARFSKEAGVADRAALSVIQINLRDALDAGKPGAAISQLNAYSDKIDELITKKDVDPRGNLVPAYGREAVASLIKSRDDAIMAVLEPMYQNMASDLFVLRGNENPNDPETLTDTAEYLHDLRKNDPGQFLEIAEMLSSSQRAILKGKFQQFADWEEGDARKVLFQQNRNNLVAGAEADVDVLVTDLRRNLLGWRGQSPDAMAKSLQSFVKDRWKDGVMAGFTDGARNIFSPEEIEVYITKFRQPISAALGRDKQVDLYAHIQDRALDYPVLFELFIRAGLDDDLGQARRTRTANRNRLNNEKIKGQTGQMIAAIGKGTELAPRALDDLRDSMQTYCVLNSCSYDTKQAIDLNILTLGRIWQDGLARNKLINAGIISGDMTSPQNLSAINTGITYLRGVITTLEDAGKDDPIDEDGATITTLGLPASVAAAMYGPNAGGGPYKHLIGALEEQIGSLQTRRQAIDPDSYFDPSPENVSALVEALGLNAVDANGRTKIQRFMMAPNGPDGVELREAIDANPVIILGVIGQIRQRFNAAYRNKDGDPEALMSLAGVVWRAHHGVNLKLQSADTKLPGAMLELVSAYGQAVLTTDVGRKDKVGQLIIMQRFLRTPKNLGKPGVPRNTWMGAGEISLEDKHDAVREVLNLASRSNAWLNVQTVLDKEEVEFRYVISKLEEMTTNIDQLDDEAYLDELKKVAALISQEGELRGDIGPSVMGFGLEQEIAETTRIVGHPMEETLDRVFGRLAAAAYGPQSTHTVKQLATTSVMLIKFFEAAVKRGLPVEQLRANVTMRDIDALFHRENDVSSRKDSLIEVGGGYPPREVSAAQQKLVQVIEELSQKHFDTSFFPGPYSKEQITSRADHGILSSQNRAWWSLNVLPESWRPNSNSVLVMPVLANGTTGPAVKINGKTAYDIIVGVKSAQVPFAELEEALGITTYALQTTVSMGRMAMPAAGEDSAAGKFLDWYTQNLRDAVGTYKNPPVPAPLSDMGFGA